MMHEELLLISISLALVVLGTLWLSILYSLNYRKRRVRKQKLIEENFAEIVSCYLYPEDGKELGLIEIQRKFNSIGIKPSKKKNVQYLILLMMRTQRAILGRNHERLQVLYKQIPPYRASISKVHKKDWYNKARGIREIYEMNQPQYLREIIPLRDHENIFVRREAQIALVVFLGWESLRFLPYLKWNMTLWQQIKIVEKLHDLYKEPNLAYLKRAYSVKSEYAIQLIIRIIRKYGLIEEIDYVLDHLDHADHEVREAAIYCIRSLKLPEEKMVRVKVLFLEIPTIAQQRQLINYIRWNSKIDLNFYEKLLYKADDIIKLTAAEILWNGGYKERVQEFYYQQYSQKEEYAG